MQMVAHAGVVAAAGGGAAGPSLPTTDLLARLTAKAGITTGATFAWADQVGSADAVQSILGDQPTDSSPVSVDFDGIDHWLDWTGLETSGNAWTVLLAISADGDAGTTQRLFHSASGVELRYQNSAPSVTTKLTVNGTTIATFALTVGDQILTIQGDGVGKAYCWIDGVDQSSGGVAVTDIGISGAVSLAGTQSSGTFPFGGSIYEVLVYDAALDATARAAARAWLTAEHGL